MRKIISFFSLLFLLGSFSLVWSGPSPQDILNQGNQAYEKGEIDHALESYLSLINQEFEGASLYYNLGNIYYKKGERGNAILWYERALRLDPRDPDIQFNLSLARSHLKDEEPGVLETIIFYFTEREMALMVLLLVWIFFGLLGTVFLKWVSMEPWAGIVLWTTGSLLLLSAGWYGGRLALGAKPWAVVISPPGEVRNGPGLDYAVGFTIPEGSRVLVLNKRPEWSQVGVPQQGLKGWMPAQEVVPITISSKLS